MNKTITTKYIVVSGLIAALYVALVALFPAFSFGQVQVRVAEALTVLPILTPAAIPGLFIGCLISNILFSGTLIDIILGSLATLIAAILTYMFRRNKWLAAAPPVVVNALIIPLVLKISLGTPYFLTMFYIAAGQAIACYALGIPLVTVLERYVPEQYWKA